MGNLFVTLPACKKHWVIRCVSVRTRSVDRGLHSPAPYILVHFDWLSIFRSNNRLAACLYVLRVKTGSIFTPGHLRKSIPDFESRHEMNVHQKPLYLRTGDVRTSILPFRKRKQKLCRRSCIVREHNFCTTIDDLTGRKALKSRLCTNCCSRLSK